MISSFYLGVAMILFQILGVTLCTLTPHKIRNDTVHLDTDNQIKIRYICQNYYEQ